jgi:site-specific recombinase XerD
MFLSKRKGIYYIFFDQDSGKRSCISTKCKHKKDALTFLAQFERNLAQRKQEQQSPSAISLQAFSKEFLKYSETRHSPKTTFDYKNFFKRFITFVGDIPIDKVEQRKIEEYVQLRFQVSVHTSAKELRYIRSSFNWAVSQDFLQDSPCRKIKSIRIPEKQPLFLTSDDLQTLIGVIKNQILKDIIIFATYTGLRRMEILTLQWDQIILDKKMLVLSNHNHLTKSKRIRTIPLNEKAFDVISRRIGNSKTYVFEKDGVPIYPDFITKNFKKCIKRANLNPKLKFHSLRHTFASWLVQKGASIYEVSKLLGHSNIKTTEIYAHLSTENFRKAVDLL